MAEKLMSFEQFRASHDETLRRQREHLRDDGRAADLLRETSALQRWIEWPSAVPDGR